MLFVQKTQYLKLIQNILQIWVLKSFPPRSLAPLLPTALSTFQYFMIYFLIFLIQVLSFFLFLFYVVLGYILQNMKNMKKCRKIQKLNPINIARPPLSLSMYLHIIIKNYVLFNPYLRNMTCPFVTKSRDHHLTCFREW